MLSNTSSSPPVTISSGLTAGGVSGQAALVTGSAVGAGLLALPAVTWRAGIFPTIIALIAVWAYMLATGILLIEVAASLSSEIGNNDGGSVAVAGILPMTESVLGQRGRWVCAILYVSIYIATVTAYVSEGGKQLVSFLGTLAYCAEMGGVGGCAAEAAAARQGKPYSAAIVGIFRIFFAVAFGGAITRGPQAVEALNGICMIGAIVAFAVLVHSAARDNATDDEWKQDDENFPAYEGPIGWSQLPRALPVMVVAFSYHNMVPSVLGSLAGKTRPSSTALLIGTGGALSMYVIWEMTVLSANDGTPEDENTIFIRMLNSAGLALPTFCLLALATSVLGVGLGCVEFVGDILRGLSIGQRTELDPAAETQIRARATVWTFAPCMLFAVASPNAFLPLLEFSSLFRQVLFGAMPITMAWKVRQRRQNHINFSNGDHKNENVNYSPLLESTQSGECGNSVEILTPLEISHAGGGNVIGSSSSVGNFPNGHVDLLPGGNKCLILLAIITVFLFLVELEHVVQKSLMGSSSK